MFNHLTTKPSLLYLISGLHSENMRVCMEGMYMKSGKYNCAFSMLMLPTSVVHP